ncbi:unnamed protein product [Pedinophyceae sp. YPF-701]|nr:unnamed protein product [Pedinophyceae sp. YPF-701]
MPQQQSSAPTYAHPRQGLEELGDRAVWSVSSSSQGHGVEALRDGDFTKTFWQSDGVAPHTVTASFYRKTEISEVYLYLDSEHDESYTPSHIVVLAGPREEELAEVGQATADHPQGWIRIGPLQAAGGPARAWVFVVAIVQNHQNGRDTKIRQLHMLGPKQEPLRGPTERPIARMMARAAR